MPITRGAHTPPGMLAVVMPRLGRPLGLLAGFLITVLGTQWVMQARGLTLLEPHVLPVRAELLYAYVSRDTPEDILLLGSSRVRAGLDARLVQAGLDEAGQPASVYKLGFAGLRPRLLLEVLQDVVVQRPPKKLLVVALESRLFAKPRGVAGEWDDDRGEPRFWRGFHGLRSVWHLPWLSSHRTQRVRALQQELLGQRVTDKNRRRLEAGVRRKRAGDQTDNLARTQWVWPEPGAGPLEDFEACLDLLAALPCPVIFVRLPIVAGFEARVMPAVGARFQDTIVAGLKARGLAFFDLNREPYPRKSELFIDQTHLTQAGCVRASRALAHDLGRWFATRARSADR